MRTTRFSMNPRDANVTRLAVEVTTMIHGDTSMHATRETLFFLKVPTARSGFAQAALPIT
jgi:hypothetical protein